MQATRVWSLGQEDPLEEQMATHSSILGKHMDRGAWQAVGGGGGGVGIEKSEKEK